MQVCFYCHKAFPFVIPVGEIVLCKDCSEKLSNIVTENVNYIKILDEQLKENT